MNNIPVLRPDYDEETKQELLKVLDSGWVGGGPKAKEFEIEFAKKVGAKYAVATNSATSALDLCLKVYGIHGGELITPASTFVSDAIVGEWNGMDVTFCDIEEDSLCIDPNSLVVTENTKAIIAVDSHGRLADIQGIREACGAFKPLIIEDAAHAMYTPGVGTGDIVVYSFQAVKTMPIFDGGMITTNDEEIYKKLKTLTWLGVEKSTYDRVGKAGYSWDYDITQGLGIKAYMTDVQAVIGLGQLKRIDQMTARRREIQERYNKAFEEYDWFTTPEFSHTVQYYTPQWRNRDGLSEYLAGKGIATSVHFKPLSEMTYWKKAVKRPIPVTDRVWLNLLSLPCFNSLKNEEVDYIIKCVIEYYA